ncbi:MFS transporter [Hyaloscypha variabilis F]|uniref:MFS transporter n=1 Tax=Hyaloscypha variabilis (strain UAMH 11265 / GT02V1 / F) TaxID=1149755 RepID=A0A2J6RK12_HYAVF|nr:MFS transporter [Hyaloscypha variabilis F]
METKLTATEFEDASHEKAGGSEAIEEGSNTAANPEPGYPTGIRFALLTISLMLAVFMVALDTNIISTAIPSITTEFHSISDIGWYNSAYLLPAMSLQPTFGKLYTYLPLRNVIIFALLCFEAGSLICALAPSSSIFILGRVVAGAGAAAIFSGGMILISLAVPIRRIAVYISVLSSMYGVAGMTGPPLGGVFTSSHRLTWRFCFYINLPFGALSILMMMFSFREPKREKLNLTFKEKIVRMDLGGTILFISSIVCLFLGLEWGGTEVPWSDSKAWGLLLGFGLLMIAFIALQLHMGENATIPLRIFLNRGVVLAQMIAVLMALGTNTHTFYLPFYFQSAKGLTASQSGIRLLPYLLSVTAMELVTGTGVNKFGVYAPFMIFGTGIYIIASSLLCTLQVSTSTARLIGFQILAGMGFGSSLNICATVVRVNVQDKDIPIASALAGFAPFFGGSLAASIGQNVFRSALTRKLLQSVSPAEAAAIVKAGATGGVAVVEESMRGVVREAYNYAVKQTFVVPAVVGGLAFLCTLGLKWKNIRKPAKEVLNVVEAGENEEKSG